MSNSKPFGRSLSDFGTLKPGERKLLEACRTGDVCQLGKQRPTEASPDNTVRASFIRFLALGGDEQAPVHEHGIQLEGAWIDELLDLKCVRVIADLGLLDCEFSNAPVLRGAQIHGCLLLSGSHMPGLMANQLVCQCYLEKWIFLNR
jgi:hypothetical protein